MAKIRVDASEIEQVANRLENIDTRLGSALRRSNAEFGAYMVYSAMQELGGTVQYAASRPPAERKARADARRKAAGITLKGVATVVRTATQTTVTFRARPHILPAVMDTKREITRDLFRQVMRFLPSAYQGANQDYDRLVAKGWIGALNNRPAQVARSKANQLGVFEFGFHRRSIAGYSPRRSDAAIRAEQNKDNLARSKVAKT